MEEPADTISQLLAQWYEVEIDELADWTISELLSAWNVGPNAARYRNALAQRLLTPEEFVHRLVQAMMQDKNGRR